jgi:phosphoglycerate dehydrogenase-like enzyme
VGCDCSAAFEMKIIVSDPAIPRRAVEGLGYEYCSDFRERLGDADVVTLHVPARDDGTAIIGAAEFALMKKGCILVNCARGTLLDEDALVSALGQGQLAGAGLDVLQEEPFRPDHPLFALPTTIPVHVSPHSSPSTVETSEAMSLRTCQNALDVIDLVRDCMDLENCWPVLRVPLCSSDSLSRTECDQGLENGVSEDSLCPAMEFADFLGVKVEAESA